MSEMTRVLLRQAPMDPVVIGILVVVGIAAGHRPASLLLFVGVTYQEYPFSVVAASLKNIRSGASSTMASISALMNCETTGFSSLARGGRSVKVEIPTMRSCSPMR